MNPGVCGLSGSAMGLAPGRGAQPGFPANVRLRQPDANDAHGRGLLLVDSIAESWHSGPSRFGGTVVSSVVADAWPT